jgi:hypothetical protein
MELLKFVINRSLKHAAMKRVFNYTFQLFLIIEYFQLGSKEIKNKINYKRKKFREIKKV